MLDVENHGEANCFSTEGSRGPVCKPYFLEARMGGAFAGGKEQERPEVPGVGAESQPHLKPAAGALRPGWEGAGLQEHSVHVCPKYPIQQVPTHLKQLG